ncbi:hypothetical protein NCC78_20035, partial [Micromonospora phytophila]|uniref:hypothetical protein n=1 Tax=Micromonospora phytophila TaxID=709888 RepID=UPI0020309385
MESHLTVLLPVAAVWLAAGWLADGLPRLDRARALRRRAGWLLALTLAALGLTSAVLAAGLSSAGDTPADRAAAGLASLTDPGGGPLALVYAPEPADGAPYRLVLLLHGAGGSARQGLDLLLPLADEHRLLLVAPQAVSSSWDLIVEGFGADVRRIDTLLASAFAGPPVERGVFGGF